MPEKTIYLANDFGFSDSAKQGIKPIIRELTGLGLEVWEPFERGASFVGKENWPRLVAEQNRTDIERASAVFAVVNGMPPDDGVMFEIGYAAALRKPTFLFRNDFRHCSDNPTYPLNLMTFLGLPADDWKRYFYTEVGDLRNPTKALYGWARY